MPTGSFELKAWARIGAEKRLEDLKEEMRAIHAAFPELRAGGADGAGTPRPSANVRTTAKSRKRKKRTMTAEARAKISAAQRKRWAKVKKA